jgi:hypothetical protein
MSEAGIMQINRSYIKKVGILLFLFVCMSSNLAAMQIDPQLAGSLTKLMSGVFFLPGEARQELDGIMELFAAPSTYTVETARVLTKRLHEFKHTVQNNIDATDPQQVAFLVEVESAYSLARYEIDRLKVSPRRSIESPRSGHPLRETCVMNKSPKRISPRKLNKLLRDSSERGVQQPDRALLTQSPQRIVQLQESQESDESQSDTGSDTQVDDGVEVELYDDMQDAK